MSEFDSPEGDINTRYSMGPDGLDESPAPDLNEQVELRMDLEQLLAKMIDDGLSSRRPEREQRARVIRLHTGLVDGKPWTFEEIGEGLGVDRGQALNLYREGITSLHFLDSTKTLNPRYDDVDTTE